jgi:hypothetical protein
MELLRTLRRTKLLEDLDASRQRSDEGVRIGLGVRVEEILVAEAGRAHLAVAWQAGDRQLLADLDLAAERAR